ncbi:hypothetical protein ACU686_10865 [Yinghuangia aomiensis]
MNRLLAFSAGAVASRPSPRAAAVRRPARRVRPPRRPRRRAPRGCTPRTREYGEILVNGSGRTLYLLTADAGHDVQLLRRMRLHLAARHAGQRPHQRPGRRLQGRLHTA